MTHPLLACLACLPKVDYYTVASRRSCSRDLDKRLRDRLRIRECSAFADNVVFLYYYHYYYNNSSSSREHSPCYVFLTENRRTDVTSDGSVAGSLATRPV